VFLSSFFARPTALEVLKITRAAAGVGYWRFQLKYDAEDIVFRNFKLLMDLKRISSAFIFALERLVTRALKKGMLVMPISLELKPLRVSSSFI
jgi:hypothetical protein